MSEVRISVVVTSYNYAKFIGQTLDSLLAQSYPCHEVIVVDDGSTDGSVDVIEGYVARSPLIRLYRHSDLQNHGLVDTIQLGIAQATGDYVAFCESDDYWTLNHLAEVVKLIHENTDAVILSNAVKPFGDPGGMVRRQEYCRVVGEELHDGCNIIDIHHHQNFNYIPTLSAVMIRRDVLRLLDFNTPISPWIDFWIYRQLLSRFPLYHLSQELTLWRQHDSFYSSDQSIAMERRQPEFIAQSNRFIGLHRSWLRKWCQRLHRWRSLRSQCRLIEASGLFDAEWYGRQHPEVRSLLTPLSLHYLEEGWLLGYDPSPHFCTNHYFSQYPDVFHADMCPLLHYVQFGQLELRQYYGQSELQRTLLTQSDLDTFSPVVGTKRILLVSHEMTATGAPRALLNMAQELRHAGAQVMLVSVKGGVLLQEAEALGIPYKTISQCYFDPYGQLTDEQQSLFARFVRSFDVIWLNTCLTLPYAPRLSSMGVPLYAWIHEGKTLLVDCPITRRLPDYVEHLERLYVVGEYCHSVLRSVLPQETKCEDLMYGLPDQALPASSSSSPNSKLRIVFAGSLEPRKGHLILAEALELLPDEIVSQLEIHVIGKPLYPDIAASLRKGKSAQCVQLMGEESHEALLAEMRQMDLLLCPSLDDPMPIVCTEAFMLSRPVIVGSNTGTASLIEEGTDSYVALSGSAVSLADAIRRAMDNRKQLPVMGRRTRQIYEQHFTIAAFRSRVSQILDIN